MLIEPNHRELSIARQCELLGLSRSSYYYQAVPESEENLQYMRLLDEQYLRTPYYGSRRMTVWLREQGFDINRKRVQRLMRQMGLEGVAPGPNTSRGHPEHQVYPYLLRNVAITKVNQVWSTDITYLPMAKGFLYLVAIIDWYSRYVLAWEVSNTLDTAFCLEALDNALAQARPQIFNSDQGVQFTSAAFTERLHQAGVQISMDGRGRAFDNIFIERLWRTVKYEEIYLHAYASGPEAVESLQRYFLFYNEVRPHQSLGYNPPGQYHRSAQEKALCH